MLPLQFLLEIEQILLDYTLGSFEIEEVLQIILKLNYILKV
jgi:hypothetical protein